MPLNCQFFSQSGEKILQVEEELVADVIIIASRREKADRQTDISIIASYPNCGSGNIPLIRKFDQTTLVAWQHRIDSEPVTNGR